MFEFFAVSSALSIDQRSAVRCAMPWGRVLSCDDGRLLRDRQAKPLVGGSDPVAVQYAIPRPVRYSKLADSSGVLRQTHQLWIILVISAEVVIAPFSVVACLCTGLKPC